MSLKVAALASVLALVAGCSHKKDRETAVDEAAPLTPPIPRTHGSEVGAPGSATPQQVGSAATPEAPAVGSAGSASVAPGTPIPLGCDQIFPKPLRDKYFPKASTESSTMGSGSCTLTLTDKSVAKVTAVCFDTVSPEYVATTFDKLSALSLTPPTTVPGVGKDTRFTATSATANTIVAWDDDSSCSISAEVPKSVNVPDFAKDALATFPVK